MKNVDDADFTNEIYSVTFSHNSKYLSVCTAQGVMNIYFYNNDFHNWSLDKSLADNDGFDIYQSCFSPND